MKRWLILILAALLLCGCEAKPNADVTEAAQIEEAPLTEPTGYYDPDSTLEKDTQGALRSYPLKRSDCYGIVTMGDDLLMFSGTEVTTLTRLSGNNLYVSAVANLDCAIYPEDPAIQVSEKGVTYYDALRQELVFLDSGLKEVSRVTLPDSIVGSPALSADRKNLYYFTEDALRAIDLDTGLDRLLREMFFSYQALVNLHCDDTVIECTLWDSYGNWSGLFLSTETGETLYESLTELSLWTAGDRYFTLCRDGAYTEVLAGTREQEPSMLLCDSFESTAEPLPSLNGAVLLTPSEDETSTTADYYDLESGRRTASVSLPGDYSPCCLQDGTEEQYIWFLFYDEENETNTICRWDLTLSAVEDETVYLDARPSYENPDLEGLAACTETAAALSEKHGVEILIWTDATEYQPWDYSLTAEYQVPLIRHCLEILDSTLSNYPEGFLEEAASGTSTGRLRLCLVRFITGNSDARGLNSAGGLQYWDDNGDAYIALALGDGLDQNLYHELSHVIDSRVLSCCWAYDNWNDLNPEGFQYDYDYIANLDRQDYDLTAGEDRAFIDIYSMSFPKEDRARIMEYAMMPGNESCFTSQIMQSKLRQLCLGIRVAFDLEESEETFFWEQYLTEPLNP